MSNFSTNLVMNVSLPHNFTDLLSMCVMLYVRRSLCYDNLWGFNRSCTVCWHAGCYSPSGNVGDTSYGEVVSKNIPLGPRCRWAHRCSAHQPLPEGKIQRSHSPGSVRRTRQYKRDADIHIIVPSTARAMPLYCNSVPPHFQKEILILRN